MKLPITYEQFKTIASEKGTRYTESKFTNEYGEKFVVIKVESLFGAIYITGDEYDWKMTSLFNEEFDVYSDRELRQIGNALNFLGEK
jgi:hypothetical protein